VLMVSILDRVRLLTVVGQRETPKDEALLSWKKEAQTKTSSEEEEEEIELVKEPRRHITRAPWALPP